MAGQEIKTTGEHPFWVEGRGWTPVNELHPGDKLRGDDGQLYPVESVTATDEWLPVYNARIADYHTYYVCAPDGRVWIWAHNECTVYREVRDGVLRYVGITKNFTRRAAEHLRNGRIVSEIQALAGITRKQARAIEHLLIEKYGRIRDRAGNLLNGILENINRGIDPRKLKHYEKELEWAQKAIERFKL